MLKNGSNPDIITNTIGSVLVPKTPETFLHDFDGNLTRDGLWTNVWNGENRLLRSESLSTVPASARMRVDWTYLPDGRWMERIVSTWVSSAYVPQSTNRYVWDGQVLLAILDANNAAELSFLRGLDLSKTLQGAGGVGGLLAVTDHTGNETHFVGNDGNGNVTLLVNAEDASESGRYAYSPFGETIRLTGKAAKRNPIRFSTQLTDATGDSKYLFREYRPTTGRWLSRDPLEEEGGVNLYLGLMNAPINFFDPDGRKASATPAMIAICLAKSGLIDAVGGAYGEKFDSAMICGKIRNFCTLEQRLPGPSDDFVGSTDVTPSGDKWKKAVSQFIGCTGDKVLLPEVTAKATPTGNSKVSCNSKNQTVNFFFSTTVTITLGGNEIYKSTKRLSGTCGKYLGRVVYRECCSCN